MARSECFVEGEVVGVPDEQDLERVRVLEDHGNEGLGASSGFADLLEVDLSRRSLFERVHRSMFAGPVVHERRRTAAQPPALTRENGVVIRSARVDDLPLLGDIERAAGAAFRDLGMAAVADADPPSMGELTRFQADGRAWVVADEADAPVAYLLVEVVDGNGHVEQVSVHPDHARQGLGRALLDAVDRWALPLGLSALTLTTYADVPWNAPYYARLGFGIVAEVDLSVGLRRIRAREEASGPAAWPRVVMRRPVGGPGS